MTLTRRARWLIAIAAVVALFVWAVLVDVPKLSGPIKGDEATYVSMALSLAKDHDLKYRPEDYQRFVKYFHQGPDGIFLKRSPGTASSAQELDYGKAFAYAVFAAPFVAIAGPGGLLAFNIVLLAICIWCAVLFCRARGGPVGGTILGVAFVMASIVPVYAVWMTSELLNVTLVLLAYFAWLYPEVAPSAPAWLRHGIRAGVIAAVLLGVATFSKPTHALLIAPIVLTALARRRWRDGLAVGLVFASVTGAWFWCNRTISGDWNYQGGSDRKSFVTHFPFDADGTAFDAPTSGNPMATNEANDQNLFAPEFLFPQLKLNVVYFLVGRDAGLVPYFFPGVVIAVWWLVRWRRAAVWQWLTALACAGSILALLVLTPSSWNGGGGPVGNRYFLSIYPTLLFLLPAGESVMAALASAVVGLTFVGGILLQPFAASQKTWLNPERWPLRLLPIELTLINDLPVRLNILRGRVLVSRDPEVFLYYMDSRMYNQEPGGFWVAPGTTDIVVRTEHPLTRLTLRIGSQIPNDVEVSIGGRSDRVSIQPGEEPMVRFSPPPGVYAATSYMTVLTIRTKSGFYPQQFDPKSQDTRYLGVFVKPTYEVK